MNNVERTQLIVRHMTRFLLRDSQLQNPGAQTAIRRLTQDTVDGHIAIDIDSLARETTATEKVPVSEMRQALLSSKMVGAPGDDRPLILDQKNRLYFHRYWQYEDEVAVTLKKRADILEPDIDLARLKVILNQLFSEPEAAGQKAAAAIAALRRLTVVSGGPGTGKTTAVVRILSLLLQLDPDLKIALAAPTGKAAARASNAVIEAGREMELPAEIRGRLPQTALTLHRLLGFRAGKNTFNDKNPMPYDVVVIDEASMVGVSMMSRLLSALKPGCRLILLGDKDQLSSVEPGSVLGDICSSVKGYSAEFSVILAKLGVESTVQPVSNVLQDCIAPLTHSFRFSKGSGIGLLSCAIQDGDSDRALALLTDPQLPDISFYECATTKGAHDALIPSLMDAFRGYFADIHAKGSISESQARLNQFRLLCAHRLGLSGVDGLNKLVESKLAEAGLIDLRDPWYAGRPVMVSKNDYGLQLFNGDIGITGRDSNNSPVVSFELQDQIREIPAPRLQAHETVYAMTVHKSQGSEFDEVAFVLPEKGSKLLGRELVYTAVTRARERVAIYGSSQVLRESIERVQQRGSGLADKLCVTPETGSIQQKLF